MAFPRIECGTWDELFRQLDGLRGWIFRGHCSGNWLLQTTLERRTPPGELGLVTESNIVREFQRRAHNYLSVEQTPTTPGEQLALLQYFGAPTRLLDFTRSPFVAAYFAFEELPTDGCQQCAILAISPAWFHGALGARALRKGGLFGFTADVLVNVGLKAMKSALPTPLNVPDEVAVGDLLAGQVEKNALDNIDQMAVVFEPNRLSERMSVQQGVFLWPGNVNRTLMEDIEAFGDPSEGVRQLMVPTRERNRDLEQLRVMNVTRASLFPGLEGFAQSFRQFPVRESPQSRALRAAIRGLEAAGPRA